MPNTLLMRYKSNFTKYFADSLITVLYFSRNLENMVAISFDTSRLLCVQLLDNNLDNMSPLKSLLTISTYNIKFEKLTQALRLTD